MFYVRQSIISQLLIDFNDHLKQKMMKDDKWKFNQMIQNINNPHSWCKEKNVVWYFKH